MWGAVAKKIQRENKLKANTGCEDAAVEILGRKANAKKVAKSITDKVGGNLIA